MKKLMLVFALMLIVSSPAAAEEKMTTAGLFAICNAGIGPDASTWASTACANYIWGVADSMEKDKDFCVPDSGDAPVAYIAIKFKEQVLEMMRTSPPGFLSKPAVGMLHKIIVANFPCRK